MTDPAAYVEFPMPWQVFEDEQTITDDEAVRYPSR